MQILTGQRCVDCQINFVVKPTLMEIVQSINPGAPPLPEWVYNGAIMGVQGGTEAMLDYLQQVINILFNYIRVLFS